MKENTISCLPCRQAGIRCVDVKTANPDFEYDTYGNQIVDNNKGITEITYNHLNLPKKITFENNDYDGTIEYLYDASGTKLRKIVTDNTTSPTTVTTTHYLDGFQYIDDKLEFFPTAEGYVKVTHKTGGTAGGGTTASYNYVFNYTDHPRLREEGNIHLRYALNEDNWMVILEEDHYYPFGLKHQGYNGEHNIFEPGLPGADPVVIVPVNPLIGDKYKYKFNGMEWQNEQDLNYYDLGMRNYDAALGRWMNIDPLAEAMRRHSPYNFAFNNPVYFIDPDGMYPSFNLAANVQTGAVDRIGGFNVATFDKDGKLIDQVFVDNLEGVDVGLDGNVYTNQNDLQTANQGVMRDVLVAADINPDAQPEQDLSEIDMLVEKVPELSRLKEEGGNPNFDIKTLDPGEMGRYNHPSRTAFINPYAFSSYLYLAFTVGHELNHAVHCYSGLYQRWLNYMPAHTYDIVRKYSEYRAHQWEKNWGNPNASGYMNQYKNEIGGWFNRLERIKK